MVRKQKLNLFCYWKLINIICLQVLFEKKYQLNFSIIISIKNYLYSNQHFYYLHLLKLLKLLLLLLCYVFDYVSYFFFLFTGIWNVYDGKLLNIFKVMDDDDVWVTGVTNWKTFFKLFSCESCVYVQIHE